MGWEYRVLGITVLFQCPKLEEIDISILLAEAIRRIHNGESMSSIHSPDLIHWKKYVVNTCIYFHIYSLHLAHKLL